MKSNINNNSGEILNMIKMKEILDIYSLVLKKYFEASNCKPSTRFLNNRLWLNVNYSLKVNEIPFFTKKLNDSETNTLYNYCLTLKEQCDSFNKKELKIRVDYIESKIICRNTVESRKKSSKKEKNGNKKTISIISSVEMDTVRDNLQGFKNADVRLNVESDFINGDKYYITSHDKTTALSSKDRDSEITLRIRKELEQIEIISEETRIRAVNEVQELLAGLSHMSDVIWSILCDNYITQLSNGTLKNSEAFISFNDIHFKFLEKTGKNANSTIPDDILQDYVNIIKTLNTFETNIKLNSKSLSSYYKFSSNLKFKESDTYSMDSRILKGELVYKDTERNGLLYKKPLGVRYSLDLLGRLYLVEVKMIAQIPISTLQYNKKESVKYYIRRKITKAKQMGKNRKYKSAEYNLLELMETTGFNFNKKRPTESTKSFLKNHLLRVLEEAIAEEEIISYIVPENIDFKYLDNNIIKFYWD